MVYWITDSLGTMSASEHLRIEEMDNTVIVNVMDLIDGSGNKGYDIFGKIDLVKSIIDNYNRVVIVCGAGISRSNVIAIGTLYVMSGIDWDIIRDYVKSKVPRMNIALDLEKEVKSVLIPPKDKNIMLA